VAKAKRTTANVWSILLLSLAAAGPALQVLNYLSHGLDVLSGPYGRLALLLVIVAGSGFASIVLMRQRQATTRAFAHRAGVRLAGSVLLVLDMAFVLALGIGWALSGQDNEPLASSRLPEDAFGIAIAPIGEGQETEVTDLSLQAADQLRRAVEKELRRAGLSRKAGLKVIGPVSNDEDALKWADRIGAELVVWGHMVPGQPDSMIPRWTNGTRWGSSASLDSNAVIGASMRGDTELLSDGVAVPHKVHAAALVGQAAISLGQGSVAVAQFDRALDAVGEIAGDTSVLRSVLRRCRGYAQWSAGQLNLARDDFLASLNLRADARTHVALGNLLLAQNDLPGAAGYYREALALDPYWITPYLGLGYAYAAQGQLEAALVQFEQARRIRPDFAPVYYAMGKQYRDHGDVFLARQAFDRCIVLSEGNEALIEAANQELASLPIVAVTSPPRPTPTPTPAGAEASATPSLAQEVPATTTYVVQRNDNLTAIADRFGVTVEAIVKANNLRNPDSIYVGQKLVIPAE